MINTRFDVGLAYVGTATIDRSRKKVFQVVGRSANGLRVCVQPVKAVKRVTANVCDGNEIAKVRDDDGFDYFLSARVSVDVDAAFDVVGMCR